MKHILLVEDDQHLRGMLAQMLTQDGHRVTPATDGAEGLRLAAQVNPDLIITDVLMPNIDGIELIIGLAKSGSGIPIIAMSGGRRSISAEFNLQSAHMLGVKATLAKPFTRDTLRQAVAEASP